MLASLISNHKFGDIIFFSIVVLAYYDESICDISQFG